MGQDAGEDLSGFQRRSAVAREIPSTFAASGIVRPAKKRSLTNSARPASLSARRVSYFDFAAFYKTPPAWVTLMYAAIAVALLATAEAVHRVRLRE